jgi:hypothetical protein
MFRSSESPSGRACRHALDSTKPADLQGFPLELLIGLPPGANVDNGQKPGKPAPP